MYSGVVRIWAQVSQTTPSHLSSPSLRAIAHRWARLLTTSFGQWSPIGRQRIPAQWRIVISAKFKWQMFPKLMFCDIYMLNIYIGTLNQRETILALFQLTFINNCAISPLSRFCHSSRTQAGTFIPTLLRFKAIILRNCCLAASLSFSYIEWRGTGG